MTIQELVIKNLERLCADRKKSSYDVLKMARVDVGVVYGDNMPLDVNAVGRISHVMKLPVSIFFLYDNEMISNYASHYGYEKNDEYRKPYEDLLARYSSAMEKVAYLQDEVDRMRKAAMDDDTQRDLGEIIDPEQ